MMGGFAGNRSRAVPELHTRAPIRFGTAGYLSPSEAMGLCQTAAGVLASWSCLREAITFPCFKQDVPTVTLTKKTVPVMGGSVDMGKENSIAWKCVCLQPAAPVLDKAQCSIGAVSEHRPFSCSGTWCVRMTGKPH